MKSVLLAFVAMACAAAAQAQINPTDPQPTCNMCPGTQIPLAELDAYTKKAIAERLVDQQVRDIDIGRLTHPFAVSTIEQKTRYENVRTGRQRLFPAGTVLASKLVPRG